MNESNPNSLLQALAAGRPAGEHPDADLLTAFAEDSLLVRERETVMAHLALCAQCREVLNLAAIEQPAPEREFELVAAVAAPAVATKTGDRVVVLKRRLWFPWAVAAAACLAIVSAVLVRNGLRTPEQTATVREQAAPGPASKASKPVAVNAPPQAAPAPGDTMEQAQRDVRALKKSPPKDKPAFAVAPEREALAAQSESVTVAAAPAPVSTQDALSATNQAVQQQQQQISAQQTENAALQQHQEQPAQEQLRSARMKAESPAAATRLDAPAFGGAMAKSGNASLIAQAQWRINAQGHVERALSAGHWQPMLTSEKTPMHVVAAVGGTVWAAGENDVLYSSLDRGLTWHRVLLPLKSGTTHTLVHIRFENSLTGTIEAADGTSWATVDGGGTWK